MATIRRQQAKDAREGMSLPTERPRGTTPAPPDLLAQYGCGPVQFSGTSDGLYERHLLFEHLIGTLEL